MSLFTWQYGGCKREKQYRFVWHQGPPQTMCAARPRGTETAANGKELPTATSPTPMLTCSSSQHEEEEYMEKNDTEYYYHYCYHHQTLRGPKLY